MRLVIDASTQLVFLAAEGLTVIHAAAYVHNNCKEVVYSISFITSL